MTDTKLFRLQKFSITQEHSALRIGTDAVLLGCSVTIPECRSVITYCNPASTGNGKLSEGRDNDNTDRIRILDIGTGCGIILLMLAQKAIEAGFTEIELTGLDIDSGSISDACTNAELFAQAFGFTKQYSSTGDSSSTDLSFIKPAAFPDCSQICKYDVNCPERTARLDIHLNCISLQQFARTSTEQYDIIASNPPFFINSLKSASVEDKIAKHNDSLPQEDLAAGAWKLLAPNGSFHLILPPNEAQCFMKLCSGRKALNKEYTNSFSSCKCNDNLTIKSITSFKTTAAKPAKRWVLQFLKCSNQPELSTSVTEKADAAGRNNSTIAVENNENVMFNGVQQREMVMMRSNEEGKGPAATSSKKEAFTEEYLSFVKDFLLY